MNAVSTIIKTCKDYIANRKNLKELETTAVLSEAAKSNPEAQFILANWYRRGVRVTDNNNNSRALYWYQQAAKNGHETAKIYIDDMKQIRTIINDIRL